MDPRGGARRTVLLYALLLLLINLWIVAPLFAVEYSGYTGSIEGTFIAIPRIMAKYPGAWSWWPFWNAGMPFENAYLPFSHWLVAAFTLLSGLPAAASFHIVTAAVYAAGAPALFWMALELSRKPAASFLAALAYSAVSISALAVPAIAADVGGVLNLRRLHVLVAWGESPHTVALALLPVAVVSFSRALRTRSVWWTIGAGVLSACVVLSNAFGIVALVVALAAWLMAFPSRPWWKAPAAVAATGIVTYCWVSPWLSPAMIRAIRANAPTAGGDFRYTAASWIALGILLSGYLLLWLAMRRAAAPPHLQFFALFAYVPTAFVAAWYVWGVAVIPQPGRYHLEMDLALAPALVFALACLRVPRAAAWAAVAALGLLAVHAGLYARSLIQTVDPSGLSEYKIARWFERNRPGERVFVPGSVAFLLNAFTDNPQLHGGHDQHTVNSFVPIVDFTIRTGANAGPRGAWYAVFWMKAFGVRAVASTGPGSTEHYKAMVNPGKFEGVLPLLWREGGDAIYEVPGVRSLAHVIPASAVVARTPRHGLDIAPAEPYVAALDDPQYPPASFRWTAMDEARITAEVKPGQVLAVQIAYERGWEAWAGRSRLPVRGDALGLTVVEPRCDGMCEITLRYTGGRERIATRALSAAAMLLAAVCAWFGRRSRSTAPA